HLRAVLHRWTWSSSAIPSALENRVQKQHCHVTAHAVTLLSNSSYRLDRSFSKSRFESIQLQDIGPRRKVRVSPTGEDCPADRHMRRGVSCNVVRISANEILKFISDPRMIGRDVVGHKIQEQVQAPFREFPTGYGQTLGPAKMLVDHVTTYTVGRPYVVFRAKVGKCAAKVIQQA